MENLEFEFWDDQWKGHTEEQEEQRRRPHGKLNPEKNDSKGSWG